MLLLLSWHCNPLNPKPLISHLTNSNGCGDLQPKVLLTVSPFRPSFPSQLDPFPRSPQALSPLSTAFTPNRSLTPLSTAFAQNARGVGGSRFAPNSKIKAQSNKSFASYYIPPTLAVSMDYALFYATGFRYLPFFQSVPHSFDVHGGGTSLCGN